MNKPGNNVIPLQTTEEENPNRLPFSLEEMLAEFDNGQVPRSTYWRAMIQALYETANHVVTGVTGVAGVKPDNFGDIPLLPKDIDAPAMVRMDGADANNQQTNQDIFGRSQFYADACKVQFQHGAFYEVLAGNAYISGIKFFYPGKKDVLVENLPTNIWLNVSWPSDPSVEREPIIEVIVTDQMKSDYIDDNNEQHFLEKIVHISIDEITDFRNIYVQQNSKWFQSIEETKKEKKLSRFKRIFIIDRDDAPFKQISEKATFEYSDNDKFISADGIWWGLDNSTELNMEKRIAEITTGSMLMHVNPDPTQRLRGSPAFKTLKGTLFTCYGDVKGRHLWRSTDNGKTWIDNFGWAKGGYDNCFVQAHTSRIFSIHGHGLGMSESGQGTGDSETGQISYYHSDDDGMTWGARTVITPQIKDPKWKYVLTSAGHGVTMKDGTIVLPLQVLEYNTPDIPDDGEVTWYTRLMYSKDNGNTWKASSGKMDAWTTEANIVENGGLIFAAVKDVGFVLDKHTDGDYVRMFSTVDLGATWEKQPADLTIPQIASCQIGFGKISVRDRTIFVLSKPFGNEGQWQRSDGQLWASPDFGRSWAKVCNLDKYFAYSDLIDIGNGQLMICYEAGEYQEQIIKTVSFHEILTSFNSHSSRQIDIQRYDVSALTIMPSDCSIRINTNKQYEIKRLCGGYIGQIVKITTNVRDTIKFHVTDKNNSSDQGIMYDMHSSKIITLGGCRVAATFKRTNWGWELIGVTDQEFKVTDNFGHIGVGGDTKKIITSVLGDYTSIQIPVVDIENPIIGGILNMPKDCITSEYTSFMILGDKIVTARFADDGSIFIRVIGINNSVSGILSFKQVIAI